MRTVELVTVIVESVIALGVIVALYALLLQKKSFAHQRQIALRDATLSLFRVWWGAECWFEDEKVSVRTLRGAFFKLVGSPNVKPEDTILAKLAKVRPAGTCFGLGQVKKELGQLIADGQASDMSEEDPGFLPKLTFFYDMIGWLGAYGLIDVDFILGPMQHHMRRTWWVAQQLIERDRQRRGDYWLDPVRHFGFQWLFEYSEKHNQADLIKDRFRGFSLANDVNIQKMKEDIQNDESAFKEHLRRTGWLVKGS